MANSEIRPVAILGGNRIPFARSDRAYAKASNQDMFTAALNGLVSRFNLQGEQLGAVVGGAVLKHSRDFNLIRESVLGSPLSPYTPAFDVQQACATGLQAINTVAQGIAAGRFEAGIGGGTDTTSDAPIGVSEGLRKVLLDLNRAKGNVDRLKLVGKLPGNLGIDIPRNGEPRTGMSMGEHAAITAKEMGVARSEQDELAALSHKNMAAAYDRGFFEDLITPYLGLTRDDNLRPDSSVEQLSTLKPVFGVSLGDATMTAGNSTPLTDGASTVLLSSDEWAKEKGLPVLAYLKDVEYAAVDYVGGKDGLLMAPTYAVPKLLERNGLTLQDFDFYEIHEAFASVVLATLQAWESPEYCKEKLGLDKPLGSIDRSKLNVNGSSLAAGHPFAATGGRIVASTAKQIKENGGGRALVSICAAGGQGITAIIEG
ncbi:Acetyl-CoA acetyltransferase OS=Tsukamurella paurometabola (strain ATCC 8368 / DSM / CCUG 35730/ CIP 100753 / JCM 10117 / KCTC 9821 / NBRC 16120 / NCIMB 702349 / NCTC 13040) OX=521096 GN=Tpau_0428 PE=3 SV=1 [Tsukamurella paurometabola]|uniref:Acetyl-CoA acetyltransferase n=1 Tax=Tsukamurella paurometabola (strain ATCC 8368 / DSM 20162 / CCUG 35730 / CIP 100753 / JCM 10117 / KCTC 9821 / NBRC 16120 / NCIMB 702349 / NCTC 13040) TaxID=521096 RepID=D5URL6_TSUPD|nr:acetyl-CoA C-acetyltransferase [Tsukamurella paurometabola]ADG77069.1 acetyl-CoA acetyltransferase [Tsukamurella paurometabola DSM 20162]SUP42664.1 3-ketoacyl-CoA thiolase [Tsukamurella paurometabola]